MTDGDPYDGRVDGGRVDQDDVGAESRDDGGPASDEPTGSRRLWWVWALLAVAAVLLGAYASTRSGLLDVDELLVEIDGGRLDPALVEAVSGIRFGSPMSSVSPEAVARRVAVLAWVADVEVERDWPGTVRIWIVEREAFVNAVDLGGRRGLLDRAGTVLEVPAFDSALPTVRVDRLGVPGTRMTGIDLLLAAAGAVTPDLGEWIVALVPTGRGVRAELVGGVDAELGLGVDFHDELRSLATVLAWVELSCIVSIDVSVHANPVVLRDEYRCS
ncbi:MAG: FtsQ-type POTRA domain-containing protein [Acidimicrobiales bacterium]